jgi:hypothetical protein
MINVVTNLTLVTNLSIKLRAEMDVPPIHIPYGNMYAPRW